MKMTDKAREYLRVKKLLKDKTIRANAKIIALARGKFIIDVDDVKLAMFLATKPEHISYRWLEMVEPFFKDFEKFIENKDNIIRFASTFGKSTIPERYMDYVEMRNVFNKVPKDMWDIIVALRLSPDRATILEVLIDKLKNQKEGT